jgi:hypothetical protein
MDVDAALARLERALDGGGAASAASAHASELAACCDAVAAATQAAPCAVQACVTRVARCSAAAAKLLACGQLPASTPRLLPALDALARAVLFSRAWRAAAPDAEWREAGGAVQPLLTGAMLAAALSHARAAPADGVALRWFRTLHALADETCSPQTLDSATLLPGLLIAVWSTLVGTLVAPDTPTVLVDACGAAAATSVAAAATRLLLHLRAHPVGETAPSDTRLACFFALQANKLAVKAAGAGERAWPAFVDAGVAARLTLGALGVAEPLTHDVVQRFDATLYRTLEAAPPASAAALLRHLCCSGAGDIGATMCRVEAAARFAARTALFCDAVLSRAAHANGSGSLRAAACSHLGWAVRTAAQDCVGAALAVAPPAPELRTLRSSLAHGIGICLSAAAAHAHDADGAAAWNAAEAFLFDAAASPHPLVRALTLDAWARLVAAAPPALCRQHAQALLALLHASLAHASPTAALRAAAHRGAAQRDELACAAVALAAAACRLLDACPDAAGAVVNETYTSLFCAPADAFRAPPAAVVLLCAGFPLRRLLGDAAAHAAGALPRAAVATADAALGAALRDGSDDGGAAERLHWCAA